MVKEAFQELIIDQVKSLLSKAIKRFAKELNTEPANIQLYILYDELKLLKNGSIVREIKWGDLANVIDKLTYQSMGFNVDKDMPAWIKKFIIKSGEDTGFEISRLSYIIILFKDELKAFMYLDYNQYKEISIEYILQTK
jgi:hypothetical protein